MKATGLNAIPNTMLLTVALHCGGGVGCAITEDGGTENLDKSGMQVLNNVNSKVEKTPQIIMIAIDSLDPSYLELNRDGNESGSEFNWLMPNVRELLETATWFSNAQGHLPSATDMNHLNVLAGTSSGKTGLIGVSGQMTVWTERGEPVISNTSLKFLRDDKGRKVDTLFHAFHRMHNNAKVKFVSGKGWRPSRGATARWILSPS